MGTELIISSGMNFQEAHSGKPGGTQTLDDVPEIVEWRAYITF